MTILVIGEALIDVTEDLRATPPTIAEYVGGSPANVALGLGRLGEDVGLLTRLAPDDRGRRIHERLAEAGVRLHRASWGGQQTATAHATLSADGSASYTFDIDWALPSVVELDEPAIVHTGSLASYLAPGARRVHELMSQARSEGAIVTYDPNVRTSVMDSEEDARDLILEAVSRADVVKLSDEDALWLFPDGVEQALRSLLDLGPTLVVITAGSGGSLMATQAGWISVPADRVPVADTIGAGDSYMAALIAELRHRVVAAGRSLDSLTFAELSAIGERCGRAAAITVSRPGADPPTLAEVLSAELAS